MKPKLTVSQVQLLNRAATLMNSANRQIRRGDFFYSGGDYQADSKHNKAWKDYGWPNEITFFMLWNMWRRNAIGKAVVKLPVSLCWLTKPSISEDKDDDNETAFEKEFAALSDRLKLWQRVKGADLRQRVGRYGALIWTVADNQTPDKPLGVVDVSKVLSVKPVFEGQLEVAQNDEDEKSLRYGQPLYYTFKEAEVGARSQRSTKSFNIHWSRVTILAEGADDGTIYGIPSLECIFNDLIDWDKIKGSGGEGFWRAAAQKFVLQAAKETSGTNPTEDELDQLTDMLADMFSGFDAMPYTGGWELKSLDTSMPTPDGFISITEKSIAAGSEIPLKILFGSQTGVKAGDEDTGHLMRVMQSRRENELTDMIEGVVDWVLEHTRITKPASYKVEWDDLTSPSAKQRIEFAKTMASINREQVSSGQEAPFKPNEIREEAGFEVDADLDDELDLPPEIDNGEIE